MGDPHMTELANACFDGVETHGCYAAASALFMPFATDIGVQTANGEVPLSRKITSSLFANKHFLRFALKDHDVFSEKFRKLREATSMFVEKLTQFYASIQNYEHIQNVRTAFGTVVKEKLRTLGISLTDFISKIEDAKANYERILKEPRRPKANPERHQKVMDGYRANIPLCENLAHILA